MKILYVYRNPKAGFSIGRVFNPIEKVLDRNNDVSSIYLPRYRALPSDIFVNVRYVLKHLERNKYDIIHITGDVYYLAMFIRNRNVVVTVHDIGFYTNFKLSFYKVFRYLFWILPLKYVTYVTFITNKTKDEFLNVLNLAPNRYTVIHNPIKEDFTFTNKEFCFGNPLILQVGTQPNKNLSRVIQALDNIKCTLVIVGKLRDEYIKLLDEKKVCYKNYYKISDEELLQLYKECDIVSFPSLYEGFGMPIIEAQAIGRPVVTSNIPPMNSIAGSNAVLVDPIDIKSIREGFLYAFNNFKALVESGRENSRLYEPSYIANKYLELYKNILNEIR